jgi:hypothetical protein
LLMMSLEFTQIGQEALDRFDALDLPKVPAKEEGWW